GVQGDAVLLPGSGVSSAHLPPFSFVAAGGMSRVPEFTVLVTKVYQFRDQEYRSWVPLLLTFMTNPQLDVPFSLSAGLGGAPGVGLLDCASTGVLVETSSAV